MFCKNIWDQLYLLYVGGRWWDTWNYIRSLWKEYLINKYRKQARRIIIIISDNKMVIFIKTSILLPIFNNIDSVELFKITRHIFLILLNLYSI
jgi:hypothetical protein